MPSHNGYASILFMKEVLSIEFVDGEKYNLNRVI